MHSNQCSDWWTSFTSIFILFQVHGNILYYLMVFLTYIDVLYHIYHSATQVFPLTSCFMVLSLSLLIYTQSCYTHRDTPAIQSTLQDYQFIYLSWPIYTEAAALPYTNWCIQEPHFKSISVAHASFPLGPSNLPDLQSPFSVSYCDE